MICGFTMIIHLDYRKCIVGALLCMVCMPGAGCNSMRASPPCEWDTRSGTTYVSIRILPALPVQGDRVVGLPISHTAGGFRSRSHSLVTSAKLESYIREQDARGNLPVFDLDISGDITMSELAADMKQLADAARHEKSARGILVNVIYDLGDSVNEVGNGRR